MKSVQIVKVDLLLEGDHLRAMNSSKNGEFE